MRNQLIAAALACMMIAGCTSSRSFDDLYQEGSSALSSGDYETAINDLEAAAKKDALNNEVVYISLAEAYEKNGQDDKSLETLQTGLARTNSSRIQSLIDARTAAKNVLLKETHTNSSGDITDIYRYEYDDSGRLKRETQMDPTATIGNLYYDYEYNDQGLLSKESDYLISHPVSLQQTISYEYDSGGHLITKTTKSPADAVLATLTCEYDDSGRLSKDTSTDENGSVDWYEVYAYDGDSQNAASLTWYSGNDTVQSITLYEYDSSGYRTKETRNTPDGSGGQSITYEYNADHQMTEKNTLQADGTVYETVTYEYGLPDAS